MGLLGVAGAASSDEFGVAYAKESVYWYRTGRSFSIVRLFLKPKRETGISGVVLAFDEPVVSAIDNVRALTDPQLLNLLKEGAFTLDDSRVVFDGYEYVAVPSEPYVSNSAFGIVALLLPASTGELRRADLLAVQVVVEHPRQTRHSIAARFFGGLRFSTHVLMPPSTVDIERQATSGKTRALERLEREAVPVSRFELWVRAEGSIEAAEVSALLQPKLSAPFSGGPVLETYYGIPPMRRGWKLAINMAGNTPFLNCQLVAFFRQQMWITVANWAFGLATLVGLLVGLLSLR